MTQFVYGGFTHPANEVYLTSFQRSYVDGPTGRHSLLHVAMGLGGKIINQGGNVAALFTQLAVRQQAYAGNQTTLSCGFIDTVAGLLNPWFLDASQAVGGVLVTNPISHGNVMGAEGVTYLNYTFGVEASFLQASTLLSWQESMTFDDIAGGPYQVERFPIQGPMIVQNTTEQSFYYATQSGSMTQNRPFPAPNPPFWPQFIKGERGAKTITYTPVKTIRGNIIETGCSWSYQYRSIQPLFSYPTVNG